MDKRKWTEGRVVELYRWTDRLYSIRVDAPVEDFEAGQFGRLGLGMDDEFIARPYSFVNAPEERPLDFYFITVPGGPLTTRMATLHSDDLIWVARKPAGFFTLSEVPNGEALWMLSTGTAVGPFLSILKTEEPWRRFERVVLVHAVRTAQELSYQDILRSFENGHPEQFTMIRLVSREVHPESLRGRITDAILDGRLEEQAGLTLKGKGTQVMLCGNPDMLRDATILLVEQRGLTENRRGRPGQITMERYW
ncbi:ferredoxin--NADP reductase [Methylocaldum sp.]|uniref:ferredoxin--NADP reductase n=1 Tax=Methylocaldum sp. TaxID=1969727 RepID=UPI002D5A3624|nr:ferredoxin--NADP reductase [Methylocaldum sp.]HYE38124.1 ferredoxin--NADP reductase [Methylocaldum sp.]